MSRTGSEIITIIVIIIILASVLIGVGGAVISVTVSDVKNITVEEKLGAHGKDGRYQIIDTDSNVYTVEDNYLLGSFDASNRYAKLKVNQTYQVKTYGIRNTFLTWYPNIIEITPNTV